MKRAFFGATLMLVACNKPAPVEPQPQPEEPTETAFCPQAGRTYVGFGGDNLSLGRTDAPVGLDTERLKPYPALADHYRAVANAPLTELDGTDAVFGAWADRWYVEPTATAFGLYTAQRLGLTLCAGLYEEAKATLSAPPTDETARMQCSAWQKRAWLREPAAAELDACVETALATSPELSVAERWQSTCAAVMVAAPFLSY